MEKSQSILAQIGWDAERELAFAECQSKGWQPGRVAVEDKHHYLIYGVEGEVSGKATGRLLHEAHSPADLPKVGDWVAMTPPTPEGKALIHQLLPRRSKLSRKVPGRETEEQILVANVDMAFIVQALDATFNTHQIERFLFMAMDAGVKPVVVLNKADIGDQIDEKLAAAQQIAGAAPLMMVSAKTGQGLHDLELMISPGCSVVFIGASGVGKSSLINTLYGKEIQATNTVRETDGKGRHTTSWRELIVLPKGGVVVDTPGMREFQLWLAGSGILEAFADIEARAPQCRFRDCSHTVEKDCAVLAAVQTGLLAADRLARYHKFKHELEHLERVRKWQCPPRSIQREQVVHDYAVRHDRRGHHNKNRKTR